LLSGDGATSQSFALRQPAASLRSLFKWGPRGGWHKPSAKHLEAYPEEISFRFNNRKNPYLFRDTVSRLIALPSPEYKEFTSLGAA
jgi:hypothetical protein